MPVLNSPDTLGALAVLTLLKSHDRVSYGIVVRRIITAIAIAELQCCRSFSVVRVSD